MPKQSHPKYKLEMYNKKDWKVYSLPAELEKSPFKLHVGTGTTSLDKKLEKIKPLLEDATFEKVIRKFKIWSIDNIPLTQHYIHKLEYRISCFKNLIDYLTNKQNLISEEAQKVYQKYSQTDKMIATQDIGDTNLITKVTRLSEQIDKRIRSFYRLINHPITIYLPKKCNYEKVVELCLQIEAVLKSSRTHERVLSKADLPLLPHISGRQETLDNNYINIKNASEAELNALTEQGKLSEEYNSLKAEIDKQLAASIIKKTSKRS